MLELHGVSAGYDGATVLHGIDLSVAEGEVVAVFGPNGAGKTTLLRVATGLLAPQEGTVVVDGTDMTGRPAHAFARAGVCHVPEGRGIFPSLTVAENLIVQGGARRIDAAIAEIEGRFPVLVRRLRQRAGSLSGGEQQMLALCRASLRHPRVLVVDEPSLGLAPIMVDRIYEALRMLLGTGVAVVLVEQYVQKALALADRAYVVAKGAVVRKGPAAEVDAAEIYASYLGVVAGAGQAPERIPATAAGEGSVTER